MNVLSRIVLLLIAFSTILFAIQRAYIPNTWSKSISVINTNTKAVVTTISLEPYIPSGIILSEKLCRLYVSVRDISDADDKVFVINTATNSIIATIDVGATPTGMALTPNESRLYVANRDSNNVMVIDTSNNTIIGTPIMVGSGPNDIVSHPNENLMYVCNMFDNSISIINTVTNTVDPTPLVVGSQPLALDISSDGSKLYVANSSSHNVSIIDTVTPSNTRPPVNVGQTPGSLVVAPDDSHVYITNYADGNVSVMNIGEFGVILMDNPIAVGAHPWGIDITPDGSKVYVTNYSNEQGESDNLVYIIDTEDQNVSETIEVGNGPVALGSFIGEACSSINPSIILYLLN